jgi:UDP-glucose 4-epimerase
MPRLPGSASRPAEQVVIPRRACITGGGGFIGSHLAEALHEAGSEVVVVDDFRTGRREFLDGLMGSSRFELVEGDVLDGGLLTEAMHDCDWVFHLQANADVRRGLDHPTKDLEQNTGATSQVLEAMRAAGVTRILFSSTGSVYGEPSVFPTPEDAPFPLQTSLYGASKLAGEGLVAAYASGFGFVGIICRFVSILGERYTHGHVIDFYTALKHDPSRITVLGNGKQEKSYLYVGDCVAAMLAAAGAHHADSGAHVYNLGTDETVIVDNSLRIITDHLGISPHVEHAGGDRGWVGDSPLIHLDTTKILSLGWSPGMTIPQAIRRTLAWFDTHESVWRDHVLIDSSN